MTGLDALGVSHPSVRGSVALTWVGHNDPNQVRSLGSQAEELVDETDFSCCSGLYQYAVTTPDNALENTTIGVDNLVDIFRGPMFDIFRQ
jgi:hypothetical protein